MPILSRALHILILTGLSPINEKKHIWMSYLDNYSKRQLLSKIASSSCSSYSSSLGWRWRQGHHQHKLTIQESFPSLLFLFIQLCIKNVSVPFRDITFKVAWIICRSIGFSLDLCCLLSLAFNSFPLSSTHLPSPGPPMGSLPGSEAVPRHPTKRYLHIIAVSAFGNLTVKSSLSLDNLLSPSQSGEFSHWCWSWPCPPRSSTSTQHAPSSTGRVVASSSRSTPSSSPPSTQQCSSSDSDRPWSQATKYFSSCWPVCSPTLSEHLEASSSTEMCPVASASPTSPCSSRCNKEPTTTNQPTNQSTTNQPTKAQRITGCLKTSCLHNAAEPRYPCQSAAFLATGNLNKTWTRNCFSVVSYFLTET